jgi:serine/threonine-protein kinase RsbW
MPDIGSIVTAPSDSDRKGHNGTWRVLAELSVPSEPGNERPATERVAEVVKELGLSEQRLENLKTAVAEATMNAMEHGNRYDLEVPVTIQVWRLKECLVVRFIDRGSGPPPTGPPPNPNAQVPDVEAKLEGMQTPRGWGLFLIQKMVDEVHITSDEVHHTVALVMHLEGAKTSAKQLKASVRREPGEAEIDLSRPRPLGLRYRSPHDGSQERPKDGSADQKEATRCR